MKTWLLGLLFLLLVGISDSFSQETPVVNQRQRNQRARIREGVNSGELTRAETAAARQDQRRIRRTERRAKADGTVTKREKARIAHKQNRASRELRRNKHDAQSRP